MGGKYSKVVNPHYPALKVLEGLSLPELKGKLSGMAKAKYKAGVYFLTKSDISWAFEQLTDLQLYYIVSLFDLSRNGNIPSLDFWGALALLSAASNDEKINFCFKMMDLNNDEYLSYSDLVIVMNCATRGVAKIRGYMVMPYEYLDRMAMEAFRVCKKSLSPEGEISMLDFRAVLLSDDLVGQYMSNLGVPVVEVDAAALVTKRSNLLREAMALRAKIADTLCALEECEEEAVQKAGERGGDIELLRVSAQELEHNRVQQALAVAAELRRKLRDKGLLVDGAGAEQGAVVPFALPSGQNPAPQRSREGRRPPNKLELTDRKAHDGQAAAHSVSSVVASDPMHPSRRYLKCDNSVFADADMSADKQSATGMYGEGFRSALLEVWLKLPQDQDLMAELDAYTVVALFDNVTVTLPYEAAQHCLQHLPRSAIGRYCFDDVLHWYLLHGAGLATKEAKGPPPAARSNAGAGGGAVVAVVKDGSHWQPVSAALQTVVAGGALSGNAWQAFTDSCMSMYTSFGATLGDTVSKAAYLRSVLDRVDQLPPHRVLKYPNHRHPDRAAAAATPSSGARSGGGPSGGAKEMGYMMKLVEFRKLTSKKPSTVQLKYVFNKPNVKLLPKPAASSQQPGEFGSRGGSSRERGRPAGKAAGTARANSRSRSRGKSPAAPHRRPGSRDGDGEGPGAVAPTTGGGAEPRPTSSGHDRYTSEAERLPPTKTIKVEEIDDWKLTFKLAFTASPFTNLATKRSKDSSRVRSANGRDFIEDFPNLQAQDLLDYFNLRQEREAEEQLLRDQAAAVAAAAAVTTAAATAAAEGEASEVAALLGGPQPQSLPRPAVSVHQPVKKKDPVVYSSVSWVCVELRSSLQPEQVELFAAALHNFFTAVPFHVRAPMYQEVFVKPFTVFQTAEAGNQARQADRVAGKFLSSLTGKGGDTAEADALFLAAPKVMLVALYHTTDHFAEVEKQLLASDVFLSRAVSSATLDVQLMQTFREVMEHSAEYVLYGERLFGPQEEDMGLGGDSMNPIRFAKEVRARRRRYEELAAGAGKMQKAELVQHCKDMGLRDTGTLAELARRAREGFELAAELVGYGELSRFGEDVVSRIFHMFKLHPIAKSDEDGGLSLWEFNKLLYHIGAPALYDSAEYQRLMKELQLLVDRDQRLRLHWLQAYYRNSGRLKAENDLLGVGSLDEKLSGRFFFSFTFEPDALTSVFNLLGSNALFIPQLVQQLTAWAAVRDVKLDAELDRLSDFFGLFDMEAGRHFSRQVLRSPGWLSKVYNEFSAALSDGEEGILPALRSYVREEFGGKYAEWEDVLQSGFTEAVQRARDESPELRELRALWAAQDRRLARRAEREAEAALVLQRQQEIGGVQGGPDPGQAGSRPGGARERATEAGSVASLSPRGSLAGSLGYEDAEGEPAKRERQEGEAGEEEEEDGDFEVEDYAGQVQQLLQGLLGRVIGETLPPPQTLHVDLPATILQLKEDLIFLYRVRGSEDLELTLEQSTAVFQRKQLLAAKIDEAQRLLERSHSLLSAHACALYDSVRLLTTGLSSVGLGSKDCCLRGYADGLDVAEYLPRGMGELAPVKQKYVEKVERAKQRKASALAALAREKRRREMTEEEREELRREAYAAQLLVWAREEAAMFAAAYAALCEAREERKSTAQLTAMAAQWETLVAAKESRYPQELPTAACQNALACVLLEFFGTRHPRGAPAQYLLETAVVSVTKFLQELDDEIAVIEEAKSPFALPVKKTNSTSSAHGEAPSGPGSPAKSAAPAPVSDKPPRDPHEEMQRVGLSCMLVMLNYVTVLVETESTGKLQQALQLKRRIYEMYHRLGAQQQERLAQGVVPQLGGIPVLPHGKVRATLERVVEEMEQYLELAAKRAAAEAEEALRRRLEEEASLHDSSLADEGSLKDPRQLRKEKRDKYAQQRRLDAAKRVEVTKQRQVLYEMIQTDKITAIFNARARGGAPVDSPGWGEQNEQHMAALNSEMDALTSSLVGSALEGDATHAAALARKRANENKAATASAATGADTTTGGAADATTEDER